MEDRTETRIVLLVLAAAALVLAAPVVGRAGAPGLADLVMGLAATCGLAAFASAAVHTLRAARRAPRTPGSRGGPR
jgi:hypothetical protein